MTASELRLKLLTSAAVLAFGASCLCAGERATAQVIAPPTVISFAAGPVLESFTPTDDGGFEDVVTYDQGRGAVKRLRSEIRKKAHAFAEGSFIDPTNAHGDLVPGLREMRGQWTSMHVSYETIPRGARVRYATGNEVMVEALHQWFITRVVYRLE